jgi:hypothetical protein
MPPLDRKWLAALPLTTSARGVSDTAAGGRCSSRAVITVEWHGKLVLIAAPETAARPV